MAVGVSSSGGAGAGDTEPRLCAISFDVKLTIVHMPLCNILLLEGRSDQRSIAANRPGFVGGSNSRTGGAMPGKTTNKVAPEVRGRAVLAHEAQHPSRWATILSIAAKIG
jgi:hypothetical protein